MVFHQALKKERVLNRLNRIIYCLRKDCRCCSQICFSTRGNLSWTVKTRVDGIGWGLADASFERTQNFETKSNNHGCVTPMFWQALDIPGGIVYHQHHTRAQQWTPEWATDFHIWIMICASNIYTCSLFLTCVASREGITGKPKHSIIFWSLIVAYCVYKNIKCCWRQKKDVAPAVLLPSLCWNVPLSVLCRKFDHKIW